MVIIASLYVFLVWILFSRLKLRWSWGSGSTTVLAGAFILAVFLGLFNYLTPFGKFVIVSRVIEVTPNVSGEVIEIPVRPNVPVKAGTVLFRIEPTPFEHKVKQLAASLAQAEQQAKQLVASYQQAVANVEGLTAQLAYNKKRMADIQRLTGEDVASLFKEQDHQVQVETVSAQLQAAQAARLNAKLAMDSEIGGVNTTVAQIQAQLDEARWQLEQTTIHAPGDGYATSLALGVGDRALQSKPVMSFILSEELAIVGLFPPNGFQTITPGAAVKLVFDHDPGRIHHANIIDIPRGVGQGQIAVSGMLARIGSIGGVNSFPAQISIPTTVDRAQLRLGMPGSAAAFADNAGVIGLLMSILVWIESYVAYL